MYDIGSNEIRVDRFKSHESLVEGKCISNNSESGGEGRGSEI